jgi:hypothetical protein
LLTPKLFAPKSWRSIAKFNLSERVRANANRLQPSKTSFVETRTVFARGLALAGAVFLISACHTLPKPEKTVMGNAGSAQGSWRAKALVKNLKNGKSVTLDLDIVAQEPDRLRIEALGPFSTHVASIASRGDDVRLSLTREKKFIEAPADRHALARVLPVRVTPADLLSLLFERPIEANNSGWKCDRSSKPAPEWSCQSGTAFIVRQPDDEGRRRFHFTTPESEMELVITEARAETPPGDSAYTLEPPHGFKIEKRTR